MQSETDTRLTERMTRLLTAPAIPQNTFIENQTSYQALYDLAYGLKGALADFRDPAEPVCLYTEEKALTAAAMLSRRLTRHTNAFAALCPEPERAAGNPRRPPAHAASSPIDRTTCPPPCRR